MGKTKAILPWVQADSELDLSKVYFTFNKNWIKWKSLIMFPGLLKIFKRIVTCFANPFLACPHSSKTPDSLNFFFPSFPSITLPKSTFLALQNSIFPKIRRSPEWLLSSWNDRYILMCVGFGVIAFPDILGNGQKNSQIPKVNKRKTQPGVVCQRES